MTPNEATTHRIADALETLVDAIRELKRTTDMRDDGATLANETPENKIGRHTLDNLANWLPLNNDEQIEWTLLSVRSVAPFEPLTEEENEELFEVLYDMENDSHPKDRVWDTMDSMGEWGKRAELDMLREIAAEDEE